VPPPASCTPPAPTPITLLDSKPASFTKSTDATFAFHSNPAGASFECRLDRLSFQGCDLGSVTYAGPLSEGTHNFRVRASNANGVGAPVSFVWTVDLTAPVANITSHPLDPSPGQSASFRYGSNEGGSKFECRLSPLEAAFTSCDTQPQVYSSLADGDYEFEVRAIDRAGNVQSTATAFPWTVDNSLLDTTPPDTAILSKPPDPSGSPVAAFTYSSSEPGSRFQCKLDTGNFNSCPSSGTSYTGLSSGAHTFQVESVDPAGNATGSATGAFNVDNHAPAAPAPVGSLDDRQRQRDSRPDRGGAEQGAARSAAQSRSQRRRAPDRQHHQNRAFHRQGPKPEQTLAVPKVARPVELGL